MARIIRFAKFFGDAIAVVCILFFMAGFFIWLATTLGTFDVLSVLWAMAGLCACGSYVCWMIGDKDDRCF